MGDVWLKTREDDAVEVRLGGETQEWMDNGKFRVAHVWLPEGHGRAPRPLYLRLRHDKVNKLTLWSAEQPHSFDMAAFSRGDYVRALEQDTMAQTISKVLYPRRRSHLRQARLRLTAAVFAGVRVAAEHPERSLQAV